MNVHLCVAVLASCIVLAGTAQTAHAQSTSELVKETHMILSDIMSPVAGTLASIKSGTEALWNSISSMLGEAAAIRADSSYIRQQASDGVDSAIQNSAALKTEIDQISAEVDGLRTVVNEKSAARVLFDVNTLKDDINAKVTALEEKAAALNGMYGTKSNQQAIATGSVIINQPTVDSTGSVVNIVPASTQEDKYVIDGDTIRLLGVVYDLAFVDAPELGESGARNAIKELERMCIESDTTIYVTPNNVQLDTKALIVCDGELVNRVFLENKIGSYNAADCQIREFVGVFEWVDDVCDSKISLP